MTNQTESPAAVQVMVEHVSYMFGKLEQAAHQVCATQPTCSRCPLQPGCKL